MLYVIGLLVRKEIFYLKTPFSTLLPNNQDIPMFKSVSMIIMYLCKIYLEAGTLVLVWRDMNTLLMMTNRVFLRVTPIRRDIKDLQIPLI